MRTLLLILLFAAKANAATWVTYAQSPTTQYDYEPTLVTKHDNQGLVLVVWSRATNTKELVTNKYELHCGSKSYRILVTNQVTNNVQYYNEDKNDRWKWALPDSTEMALIDTTCNYFH